MAETSGDYSLIQDEDVLRRMWQDTEDFGKKKEIRAHMYKIREARLRDFYSSGEVGKDIQKVHTMSGHHDSSKGSTGPTHADSLADHSFLSLKSKEIRDSESPTRDVNYRHQGRNTDNKGWNVTTSNTTSEDGKKHTTTRLATTAGSEKLDDGIANYAGKCEQVSSVYKDGDDKNFKKSVGASSKSLIEQDFSGGDDQNSFKSSSTTSSSSSRVVTEQHHTSDDAQEPKGFPAHYENSSVRRIQTETIPQDSSTLIRTTFVESEPQHVSVTKNHGGSTSSAVTRTVYTETIPQVVENVSSTITRKTYTENIPEEFKKHPSFVDGNTKVYTETKTLPDGSTVTTTRYETKGGKAVSSSSSNTYSSSSRVSSNQKSSSVTENQNSSRIVKDARSIDDVDTTYIKKPTAGEVEICIIKSNNDVNQQTFEKSLRNTSSTHAVDIRKTQEIDDIKNVNTGQERKIDIQRDDNVTKVKRVQEPTQRDTTPLTPREPERIGDNIDTSVTTTTTTKTTTTKVGRVTDDAKSVNDNFIETERQHIKNTTETKQPIEYREPLQPKRGIPHNNIPSSGYPQPQSNSSVPQENVPPQSYPSEKGPVFPDSYELPERRQPIKPGKSEFDIKTETTGQYDTTYRSEFTNKRISVDVSPTHNAFARSLRAISPDRCSKSPSLRTSTSSLRSSSSPDKYPDRRYPTRSSPDRKPDSRGGSPTKPRHSDRRPSSDRYPNEVIIKTTTTTTRNDKYSPEKKTPSKETLDRLFIADTITKKRREETLTKARNETTVTDRKTKPQSPGYSPERKPTQNSKSPERRTVLYSPGKKPKEASYKSQEYNSDTFTRRQKINAQKTERIETVDTESIDSNTVTRRSNEIRSRSTSPTSIASDIEFVRNNEDIITDLDDELVATKRIDLSETNITRTKNEFVNDKRPTSLKLIETVYDKSNRSTDRIPTDVLRSPEKKAPSPTKSSAVRKDSPKKSAPLDNGKQRRKESPVLKRKDTYEERCRQILGISDNKTIETDTITSVRKPTSPNKESPKRISKSPEKIRSPTKESPQIGEFPSQVRKSPEKKVLEKLADKPRTVKDGSNIQEFPSQIRRVPEKEPFEKSSENSSHSKTAPTICEFPSQIRKSPLKEPLQHLSEKKKPTKDSPSVQEFPSQIRKSPVKEPLEKLPKKSSPTKTAPIICEFPSQIRKSPTREPLEHLPEKKKPTKDGPSVQEFPSQIRKSPEKQPPEKPTDKVSPIKSPPKINEFSSQIRKVSTKESREELPEKKRPTKCEPSVQEFPSQIRKSPERETLQKLPEKVCLPKEGPSVQEFPSQIRKSPEKEPFQNLPAKVPVPKEPPSVQEFPSQIRKSPEREPLQKIPDKVCLPKEAPSVQEFPSQIRKPTEKEPLEKLPQKEKLLKTTAIKKEPVQEFPSQTRKLPEKKRDSIPDFEPTVHEFPDQSKKSPERKISENPEDELISKLTIRELENRIPVNEPLHTKKFFGLLHENEVGLTTTTRKETKTETVEDSSSERSSPESEPLEVEIIPSNDDDEVHKITVKVNENMSIELKDKDISRKQTTLKKNVEELEEEVSTVSKNKTIFTKKVPKSTKVEVATKKIPQEPIPKRYIPRNVTDMYTTEIIRNIGVLEYTDEDSKVSNYNCKPKVAPQKVDQPSTKRTTNETTVTKKTSKFSGEIEYKDEHSRSPKGKPRTKPLDKITPSLDDKSKKVLATTRTPKVVDKNIDNPKRITLSDAENISDSEVDDRVHIRTHRIDDYYTKQTVKQNGDVKTITSEPKTKPKVTSAKIIPENRKPVKLQETVLKKQKTYEHERKPCRVTEEPKKIVTKIYREISSPKPKPESDRQISTKRLIENERVTNTSQTMTSKNVEVKSKFTPKSSNRIPQKSAELSSPKRHVVTTTINVTPGKRQEVTSPARPTTKTTVTTIETTKIAHPKTERVTRTYKRKQNDHVSSDVETDEDTDKPEDSVVEDNDTAEEITFVRTRQVEDGQETKTQTTKTNKVITRTTSDQVIKTPHKAPIRGQSKPELISTKPFNQNEDKPKAKSKIDKKCITTKSIIINNDGLEQQREVVVDLQRSKSSREPTPDRLCPHPISSDEDMGIPRYPDEINEPDDGSLRRRPKKKLIDAPIIEDDDTEYNRITDVTEETTKKTARITETDKVEESDECLLSVNQKVTKFLDTADKLTKKLPERATPASKVSRLPIYVDEDLKEDECLLSVSNKVNKFSTTAEQLSTTHVDRPRSPKLQHYPDEELTKNVSEKVTHFITTAEKVGKPQRPDLKDGPVPKVQRPDLKDVDETIRTDECLLSVSDKISKFITTAENLKTPETKKPIQPESIRKTARATSSPSRQTTRELTECVQIDEYDHMYKKTSKSPEKRTPVETLDEKSPRRVSNVRSREESPLKDHETTPKTSRRGSNVEENKTVMSATGRLRSTASIKRAKALFENIVRDQDTPKQRDILNRPSVFEGRKLTKFEEPEPKNEEVKLTDIGVYKNTTSDAVGRKIKKVEYSTHEDDHEAEIQFKKFTADNETVLKSSRLIMEKNSRRSCSPEKGTESIGSFRSHESSPDKDLPGYMKPLNRNLRPNSPHRENIMKLVEHTTKRSSLSPVPDDIEKRTTKFGVTLRRTDSGRAVTSSVTTITTNVTDRKKSDVQLDIEEIYDLEVLESMLEKAVGYDQRRSIRAQIRIVKQLISENKLTAITSKKVIQAPVDSKPKREQSPEKPSYLEPIGKIRSRSPEKQPEIFKPTDKQRKSSADKMYRHIDLTTQTDTMEKSTEYQSSYSYKERRTSSETKTSQIRNQSPEAKTVRVKNSVNQQRSPEKLVDRQSSPEKNQKSTVDKTNFEKKNKKTEATAFKTELKPTTKVTKTVTEDKPEWVTQRILKKTTERSIPAKKVVVKKESIVRSSSPNKEIKPTDVIISSYGVGPMDENGSPLFGLKALRAQAKSEKTKVQGTVVKSHYYSENGQEPVGEVTVIKYSTDPADLGTDEEVTRREGVTSVTTTQKFGARGTPSLKSIIDTKKQKSDITDENKTITKSTKVTRRGSVKALSQKFIDNAVETSKSERQSSYPKAGLILRTSSFKNSTGDEYDDDLISGDQTCSETVTVRKETSSSSTGGTSNTFLNTKTRVTGVQDVIERMRNSEHEVQEGDTLEDAEARTLLNKFIGAQVILSGIESSMGTPTVTTNVKRTTTTTSTTTSEGGKPKTVLRTFQHPVQPDDLATIWDEQTLRLLLEQSTDYEERRIIRARLREVMAEQEACAELVSKASEEEQSGTVQETSKKTITEGPITTTQVRTRVTTQVSKKPVSPFAKFRELDKQNSINTPPSTPKTPTGSGPLFKFTDPALSRSASTVKDRLLQWCQMKTKEYENIQLDNFSTSWADGLAFCALIHHFLPDAFDYHSLTPKERRHNFTLAFQMADEKADIAPLLDVDDMVATRRPDWKCVFTYVQSIYRRFKDQD